LELLILADNSDARCRVIDDLTRYHNSPPRREDPKKIKVSGVGVQVSAIKKFQITKHKYQTNHNDQNLKFQTIGV
jgi:hypothetical protein